MDGGLALVLAAAITGLLGLLGIWLQQLRKENRDQHAENKAATLKAFSELQTHVLGLYPRVDGVDEKVDKLDGRVSRLENPANRPD